MPIPSPHAPRRPLSAGCNTSSVTVGKDGSHYAFFGVSNATACEVEVVGAPLAQFVDAFEQHCGLRRVEEGLNDSWVPRSILGGPGISMAIPPQQPSNPAFQNCLNFEAMEIGYPRSEALRLGLCAGLPFGMLLSAWSIIAALKYVDVGRRRRARQPPPPPPPNTPELVPTKPRARARSYGACIRLADMNGVAPLPNASRDVDLISRLGS